MTIHRTIRRRSIGAVLVLATLGLGVAPAARRSDQRETALQTGLKLGSAGAGARAHAPHRRAAEARTSGARAADARTAAARDAAAAAQNGAAPATPAYEWVRLFNGRDLAGWTPKFAKHDLGTNLHDTFRVEDGLLKVRYDRWTAFNGEFGHLFFEEPFSYYLLAAEYRFVGEQVAGAQAWAMRNNGLMLHSPHPKTMLRDQNFPISLEIQLLGGLGKGPRTTANLCTPGTHVVLEGQLHTAHCTNSTSKTYDGDQWVRVEVLVHGDEILRHVVEGQTVLEYSKPQIGGGSAEPVDPAVKIDGTPLTGGYISIQAETAPIDYRTIELVNLEGCTDRRASNYKPYIVKSNPSMCR